MARMPGASWEPLAANWADQGRCTPKIFCLHTMVGSLDGTRAYFRANGYKGTESHFGTGYDGEKVQWQDTDYRADANLDGNGEVVSIENADYGVGFPKWDLNDGGQVPAFTDEQLEANADILVWGLGLYRIPPILIPDTLPGRTGIAYHRQGVDPYRVAGGVRWSSSYGKVCPGDRRIEQIVNEIVPEVQRRLEGGERPPTPRPTPTPRAGLVVDGQLGPATYRALQTSLNATGASPRLTVDGDFGPATKRALQARLNHVRGPVGIDGVIGPQTVRALQRWVGVAVDGEWGSETTRGMQRTLNAGKF